MNSQNDHCIKLLVRQFLFSKSPLKREDLMEIINNAKLDSQPESSSTTRSRDQFSNLLGATNDTLKAVFGYSIVDTSEAPALSQFITSSSNNSAASRKQSLQRSSNSQSSSTKRYLKINSLDPQLRLKLRPLLADQESINGNTNNSIEQSIPFDNSDSQSTPDISLLFNHQIPTETCKFIILSIIAFSHYSINRTELVDCINILGIIELSNGLNGLLDELVHDRYLHVSRKENEQGIVELFYEWSARTFLELPENELVDILRVIFPDEQDLHEKLLQSIKLR